ncbi:hypothetical protein QTN47_11725 [Danxiaibacter flavus]|uniref:Uncharacterized protein n=1 Tax=Danxiaibacter flavus TaxID=3049108 RepID=A0ABV3ZF96_9BACT|nr:hypothetical protein QNM32_11730 [Chitinophagaceae bacterium DXS]
MNQNIEINIDQIVLHGFAHGDKLQIGEALQTALTEALAKQGITPLLKHSIDIPYVNAGTFSLQTNSKPASVGAAVANSVHATLKGKG